MVSTQAGHLAAAKVSEGFVFVTLVRDYPPPRISPFPAVLHSLWSSLIIWIFSRVMSDADKRVLN